MQNITNLVSIATQNNNMPKHKSTTKDLELTAGTMTYGTVYAYMNSQNQTLSFTASILRADDIDKIEEMFISKTCNTDFAMYGIRIKSAVSQSITIECNWIYL